LRREHTQTREAERIPLKLLLLVLVISPLTHSHSAVLNFLLTDNQEVVVLGDLSLTYGFVNGEVTSFNVAVEPAALEFLGNLCRVCIKAFRNGNHDRLIYAQQQALD
jgi:hypothetical protein